MPEISTTVKTIWKVTSTTFESWNSRHASKYQRVVQPAGSHVPSQRVAKELTSTAAMTARRLRTKRPASAHTAKRHSFEPMPWSRIMACPFR